MSFVLAALVLTHGAAVGEVTESSAVLWARSSASADMVVEYGVEGKRPTTLRARSETERDLTARAKLEALQPGSLYRYRVWFEEGGETSAVVQGSFRTAPLPSSAEPVRFVFGGDLGGHDFCRDETSGYAIFERMRELEPRFFVANGDMIYGDSDCPAARPDGGRNVPGGFPSVDDPSVDWADPARVREVYLAHWRYNRADASYQRFLLEVPLYVQWDDHEVINDFGAEWAKWAAAPERAGYPNLVRAGRDALFDFHPLWPHADEPHRIYRSFRWGADLELFLLDARSYRSPNDVPDEGGSKTLLGRAQLEWLKSALASSTATWKVVSSDVPLSIATGTRAEVYGRDSFADGDSLTGSETELSGLLSYLDAKNIENVVFLVTDVHFATSLRYHVDLDADGDRLSFHELVSGPLSAGKVDARPPDGTFRPEVLYAEGGFFNFAVVNVETTRLRYEVRDDQGRVRRGSELEINAAR